MDASAASASASRPLPAVKYGRDGARRVDYRAVLRLAAPLFLNSSLQAVLNLTDTWFVGRISADATAGVGAVYFLVVVFILILGGGSMAVQTLVAQAYGAGDKPRAAAVAWSGAWVALLMAPLFVALSLSGSRMLAPFALAPEVQGLALEYWFPRMLGAAVGVTLWSVTGFFNGIGRTRVTLAVMAVVALANGVLNEVFIFRLGLGVAGAAWATTAAQVLGLGIAAALFLHRSLRQEYRSHRSWRPQEVRIGRVLALGVPMGFFTAVDLIGLTLFQLMQVKLGAVEGATSQIVMMLTSVCYFPAIGFALAGTTLVGQSIGAGDKAWAAQVGNATIGLAMGYMGVMGVALALAGPWIAPFFITASDPRAGDVVALTCTLLWVAAGYQIFDGLNLGSGFCLRGAGDVKVPALLVVGLSWFGFVPLTHMLSFGPGAGWVDFLPGFGFGALGGWIGSLVYTFGLGTLLYLRWHSRAWQRIRLC